MIESLKALMTNGNVAAVSAFIEANPGVLEQKDESGRSGFLIIAYSGIQDAFKKAKELKQTFTFHEAIVSGRQDLVIKYLDEDKKLANAYSADGFTPLSLAAFFDQSELAKLLLDQGGEPALQATNDFKVNALHSAVAKNNLELCKLFLQSNVDVNIPQAQNVTPLHAAAHHGNLAIVKLLVENGARVNVYMDNGKTPIDFAESDGHAEVGRYLHDVLQSSDKKES